MPNTKYRQKGISMRTLKAKVVLFAIILSVSAFAAPNSEKEEKKMKVSAPRESIEAIKKMSPEMATLTDELLFKDIWNRPGLSPRDRSLITITILTALNRTEQIEAHLKLGLQNGLTKEEIDAAMTHIAFYAGWPSAMSGLQHFKTVLEKK